MRDWLLVGFGALGGMSTFALMRLCHELYGKHEVPICALCKEVPGNGYDDDLGYVCAKCEVELSHVGAQLMRISNKI